MSALFESLTGLELLDPWLLLLALLVPLALWLQRRRGAPAIRFAPAYASKTTVRGPVRRKRCSDFGWSSVVPSSNRQV